MGKPEIRLLEDRLTVRLHGLDAAVALTRGFDVPYASIRSVEAAPATWPAITRAWGVGLRLPPLVLKGSIGKPFGPWDAFYWQGRGTREVLRLRLEGHPRYREAHLDVDHPAALADQVRRRLKARG